MASEILPELIDIDGEGQRILLGVLRDLCNPLRNDGFCPSAAALAARGRALETLARMRWGGLTMLADRADAVASLRADFNIILVEFLGHLKRLFPDGPQGVHGPRRDAKPSLRLVRGGGT